MMWLSVLLFPLLVTAQTGYCQADKACTSNAMCADTINSINGICCQGKCLPDRPNADLGQFCNETDPCAPSCNARVGGSTHTLRCGPNNICITDVGTHCNCTQTTDCVSRTCTTGKCFADPGSLAVGAPCLSATECESAICTGGVCVGKTEGTTCTQTNECAAGLTCFRSPPPSASQCHQKCATNTALPCCNTGTGAAECASPDAWCVNDLCSPRPALGGVCTDSPCKDPAHICARNCTGGSCSNLDVCQVSHAIADGNACDVNSQCAVGSECAASNQCAPLPTLGQACSGQCADPTQICDAKCNTTVCGGDVCQMKATIAAGNPCASSDQCMAEGICQEDSTRKQICFALGSIPNGQFCSSGFILQPQALCMGYNASSLYQVCTMRPGTLFGSSICIDPRSMANGQACTASEQCAEGLCGPKGGNATSICIDTNVIQTGDACDYSPECVSGLCAGASSTNNTKICKAVAAVPENGACVDHRECADYTDKYALCATNKCTIFLGKACTSDAGGVADQCGDAVTPGTNPPNRNRALYCACTGQCALVPPPTPTPAVNNNDCSSRQSAWNAVRPFGGFRFPADMGAVSGSNLTTLLDLQCCQNCDNLFITLAIDLEYVVDCTANTITPYVPSCNPAEAPKAFQNCPAYPQRGAVAASDAPTTAMGLGAVAVVAMGCMF